MYSIFKVTVFLLIICISFHTELYANKIFQTVIIMIVSNVKWHEEPAFNLLIHVNEYLDNPLT